MNNHFYPTLNHALESVGLLECYPINLGGIAYGETKRYQCQKSARVTLQVSISRDNSGMYETPVFYKL